MEREEDVWNSPLERGAIGWGQESRGGSAGGGAGVAMNLK